MCQGDHDHNRNYTTKTRSSIEENETYELREENMKISLVSYRYFSNNIPFFMWYAMPHFVFFLILNRPTFHIRLLVSIFLFRRMPCIRKPIPRFILIGFLECYLVRVWSAPNSITWNRLLVLSLSCFYVFLVKYSHNLRRSGSFFFVSRKMLKSNIVFLFVESLPLSTQFDCLCPTKSTDKRELGWSKNKNKTNVIQNSKCVQWRLGATVTLMVMLCGVERKATLIFVQRTKRIKIHTKT